MASARLIRTVAIPESLKQQQLWVHLANAFVDCHGCQHQAYVLSPYFNQV